MAHVLVSKSEDDDLNREQVMEPSRGPHRDQVGSFTVKPGIVFLDLLFSRKEI